MKSDIQFAIHSYLAWRQKGMPEPRPGEPIRFLKKAMVEQEVILAATGEGEPVCWVDRVRTFRKGGL